jgi:acetyl esterase
MASAMSRVPVGLQGVAVRALYALPEPLRRLAAGPPVRIEGNELALDAQLLLRMIKLTDVRLSGPVVEDARRDLEQAGPMLAGPVIQQVRTRDLRVPVEGGDIPARLYTPGGLGEESPLLVYYHGGGFTVGSIRTHDNLCRFLAKNAELRVLSIGYRLGPEHPFPTAPADALAGFAYAVRHADELGAEPSAIAVGGDSAGANLAAVTAYQALRAGGSRPAFQLLFYPRIDLANRHPSRDTFADGFFLTDEDLEWFDEHYLPDRALGADPLASPLLAEDLGGLPPTYLSTAGFDPLRDEGEAFGNRLCAAGVPVVARCHTDLIHGFVNFIGIGRRFREAVAEAAGALRTGLELRSKAHAEDLFGKRSNSGPRSRKEHGNPTQGH